ncbi:hypothetical protein KIN20_018713 [Parelaphostrongylus tenuis]|uniref:Uncharacterized protein n=1 Tax=Parelaphostrongylus tenuis TaxID=148309 RepID=A0AAD5QUK6_PARTN|nr:hypothetical protein KIN20_018713 [Parelaphostrongylus tenuis]
MFFSWSQQYWLKISADRNRSPGHCGETSYRSLRILMLDTISTVLGCGVMPPGQVLVVLERQARSALLPDAVISTILYQLTINITYELLNCQNAANPADTNKIFEADAEINP